MRERALRHGPDELRRHLDVLRERALVCKCAPVHEARDVCPYRGVHDVLARAHDRAGEVTAHDTAGRPDAEGDVCAVWGRVRRERTR